MQDVFNSAQVLINIAQRAQAKGLLTLDEAVTTKQAIDIQADYFNKLGQQVQVNAGVQDGEGKPEGKTRSPKG